VQRRGAPGTRFLSVHAAGGVSFESKQTALHRLRALQSLVVRALKDTRAPVIILDALTQNCEEHLDLG
jgi:hypothetical protein